MHEDEKLASQIRQGDLEVLATLYDRHEGLPRCADHHAQCCRSIRLPFYRHSISMAGRPRRFLWSRRLALRSQSEMEPFDRLSCVTSEGCRPRKGAHG